MQRPAAAGEQREEEPQAEEAGGEDREERPRRAPRERRSHAVRADDAEAEDPLAEGGAAERVREGRVHDEAEDEERPEREDDRALARDEIDDAVEAAKPHACEQDVAALLRAAKELEAMPGDKDAVADLALELAEERRR